jgi:hypothetical protein
VPGLVCTLQLPAALQLLPTQHLQRECLLLHAICMPCMETSAQARCMRKGTGFLQRRSLLHVAVMML